MINAIRSIALGCAALLGAATVTTVAIPTAHADHDHHDRWRGNRHHGYYRGGGPVVVAPRPYYGPRYRRHRHHGYYRGGGPGYYNPGYAPGYYGPTVLPPRPGVTFHIGR